MLCTHTSKTRHPQSQAWAQVLRRRQHGSGICIHFIANSWPRHPLHTPVLAADGVRHHLILVCAHGLPFSIVCMFPDIFRAFSKIQKDARFVLNFQTSDTFSASYNIESHFVWILHLVLLCCVTAHRTKNVHMPLDIEICSRDTLDISRCTLDISR